MRTSTIIILLLIALSFYLHYIQWKHIHNLYGKVRNDEVKEEIIKIWRELRELA